MLGVLVSDQAVLGAKHLAAVGVCAHVRVDRRVEFLVLCQVVLANKTLAAVGPLADKPPSGVNVAMSFQMRLLSESLSTVNPVTHKRFLSFAAALTLRCLGFLFLYLLVSLVLRV